MLYIYNMEVLFNLIDNYMNKWRHTMMKDDYFNEFGKLTDDEVNMHNAKTLENYELVMNSIKKLNELDPFNMTDEEKELVANIVTYCEEFTEKDFITIV